MPALAIQICAIRALIPFIEQTFIFHFHYKSAMDQICRHSPRNLYIWHSVRHSCQHGLCGSLPPRPLNGDRKEPQRLPLQCKAYSDSGEPNWDEEMSIFKKRTLKPSQLEALRKLEEEKVDIGRVRGNARINSNITLC